MWQPTQEILRGNNAYWQGWRWLRAHPACLLSLMAPVLIGILGAAGTLSLFFAQQDTLMRLVLPAASSGFWGGVWHYLSTALLYIAAFALALMSGLVLSNILAAPIYDWISAKIEKDLYGYAASLSLWQSLRLVPEELKKAAAIGAISLALLLIPGINILAIFVSAFLLGWDFYDYTLARHGFSFKERLRMVRQDAWAVFGLSIWLIIPGLQLVLLPFTVAGGTILSGARLQQQRRLKGG